METGSELAPEQSPPEVGTSLFVPSLVEGLHADDDETVESAGFALCLLAQDDPESARDVVTPLTEHLVDHPREGPVLRTLAELAETHGDAVRESLFAAADPEDARVLHGHVREAEGWGLPEDLWAATGTDKEGLVEQLQQLVDPPEVDDDEGETAGDDRTLHVETDTGEEVEEDGSPMAAAERVDTRPASVRRRHERIQRVATSDVFLTIESRSHFDELEVIAPKTERRYANVVRTRGVTDGEERGVAVRLCHTPGERGFSPEVATQLADWHRVDESGVVATADWGEKPRPWVATEYVEETLADRGRLTPREFLVHATTLTAALAQLHQHDVVHGGIDPHNVAYGADSLDDATRPMLDNVGLMSVYRTYFDPTEYLDPRYAAPEYFEREYGKLDHATDIYQLGMVLYNASTGRPPFDGSFAEIRQQVLKQQPPAPSTLNDAVPEAFDEIVAKATGKQKLTRYETATQFHRDVRRLCEQLLET